MKYSNDCHQFNISEDIRYTLKVDSVLTLAAALSVQSPFTNNAFKDPDCVAARRNLDSDHGDPITLLNAYREWLEVNCEGLE